MPNYISYILIFVYANDYLYKINNEIIISTLLVDFSLSLRGLKTFFLVISTQQKKKYQIKKYISSKLFTISTQQKQQILKY